MKSILYALLGAASGALASAGMLFLPLGRISVPGFRLFGSCIGLVMGQECGGLSIDFFVYPGLVFGIAFAVMLLADGWLGRWGALAFALASFVSNALAVAAWTAIDDPLSSLLGQDATGDLMFCMTGPIAGAVGGGALGYCAARLLRVGKWPRMLAAGAVLGLLLPLVGWSSAWFFAFYMLWQGGYAAMLANTVGRNPSNSA